MNRFLPTFAFGLAAAAAVLTGISGPKGQPTPQSYANHSSSPGHKGPSRPSSEIHPGAARSDSERPAKAAGAIDERATALRSTALSSAIENYPSRVELQRRAALVEQEANHELRRLVPLLGLTPAQEERVFQQLVRSSPHFSPGMMVGGEALAALPSSVAQTPGSANSLDGTFATSASQDPGNPLLAELTDTQIEAYLQDADARSAWWQEYLAKVASNLDASTPILGTPAVTDPAVTTPGGDTALPTKDARAPSDEE